MKYIIGFICACEFWRSAAETDTPTLLPSTAVESATPTTAESVCKWDGFGRSSSCDVYDSILGEFCNFNADDGGILSTCRRVSLRFCDTDEINAIDGCYESCRLFHQGCCCPASSHAPTYSPTKSSMPSSGPTSKPSDVPSIFCKWKDFNYGSSCDGFNRVLGEDCMFNAGQPGFRSQCETEATKKCNVDSINDVSGCNESCENFHWTCCCPSWTSEPTFSPTDSLMPSSIPTKYPSSSPSLNPTNSPSSTPSINKSMVPSLLPTSEPSNAPSIFCKWTGFSDGNSCRGYNLVLGEDCMFNAKKEGLGFFNKCQASVEKCDTEDIKAVNGCSKSCQIFHKTCCCPSLTSEPTTTPTESLKPSNTPTVYPTLLPSSTPTFYPTENPTINCQWNGFTRLSSCAGYNTLLGGDCMFNAGSGVFKAATCEIVAREQCNNEQINEISGCFESCNIFHYYCCCPATIVFPIP